MISARSASVAGASGGGAGHASQHRVAAHRGLQSRRGRWPTRWWRSSPSSGRVTGVLGLGICVADRHPRRGRVRPGIPARLACWAALFAAVLIWAAMLRPRVRVTAADLRPAQHDRAPSRCRWPRSSRSWSGRCWRCGQASSRYVSLGGRARAGDRRSSRTGRASPATTRRTRSSSRSGSTSSPRRRGRRRGSPDVGRAARAGRSRYTASGHGRRSSLLGFTAVGFVSSRCWPESVACVQNRGHGRRRLRRALSSAARHRAQGVPALDLDHVPGQGLRAGSTTATTPRWSSPPTPSARPSSAAIPRPSRRAGPPAGPPGSRSSWPGPIQTSSSRSSPTAGG